MTGDNAPATKGDLQQLGKELGKFLEDMKESLERELHSINDRLDMYSARMDRHGGMLRGGTTHIARLVTWSEDVDKTLERQQAEINDLRKRLDAKP